MMSGVLVEAGSEHAARRQAVEHYVGIDVSLELSSVCIVDVTGKIVAEAKVESDPDAISISCVSSDIRSSGLGWRQVVCHSGDMRD